MISQERAHYLSSCITQNIFQIYSVVNYKKKKTKIQIKIHPLSGWIVCGEGESEGAITLNSENWFMSSAIIWLSAGSLLLELPGQPQHHLPQSSI